MQIFEPLTVRTGMYVFTDPYIKKYCTRVRMQYNIFDIISMSGGMGLCDLLNVNFLNLVALTLDVETVLGISYAYTLKVEILDGSVLLSSDF